MKVAIGLITYKRPNGLKAVLESLGRLNVPANVDLSVLVVSNEHSKETQNIVQAYKASYKNIDFIYEVEEKVGIPHARNKTVVLAARMNADALIYIDDDEICPPNWLSTLVTYWQDKKDRADIFTGPVCPIFPDDAPKWAKSSDVYDSMNRHRDGALINRAYTNNTLVSSRVIKEAGDCFHAKFTQTGSSDLHYFKTLHIHYGFKIMWCNNAFLHETVPRSRLGLLWLAKRGFRSGAGDTITRLLLHRKSIKSIANILFLSCARLASAFLLLIAGILTLNAACLLKGYRRFFSSVGSLAGLLDINYKEYKTIHE